MDHPFFQLDLISSSLLPFGLAESHQPFPSTKALPSFEIYVIGLSMDSDDVTVSHIEHALPFGFGDVHPSPRLDDGHKTAAPPLVFMVEPYRAGITRCDIEAIR